MAVFTPFWSLSGMKAFLFDWDGVIAETHLDFSSLRNRYYSGRRAMLLEDAHTLTQSEQSALMCDLYALEMEGARTAVPVPGIFELLDHLQKRDVPWGVVSRNCRDSIHLAAKTIGVSLPDYVGSRDDDVIKPDPRSLWRAADALGCAPAECAFVGDFIYDMVGARRAGMRGILVQRHEPEWGEWYDVAYPAVTDLRDALRNPEEITPWEYRDVTSVRGKEWLRSAFELRANLPAQGRECSPEWLATLASVGVGRFAVREGATLTPRLCRRYPTWDHARMGESLPLVVRDFFKQRYPLVRVFEETDFTQHNAFPEDVRALIPAVEEALRAR